MRVPKQRGACGGCAGMRMVAMVATAVTTTVLALSSCISMAPPYKAPALPVQGMLSALGAAGDVFIRSAAVQPTLGPAPGKSNGQLHKTS